MTDFMRGDACEKERRRRVIDQAAGLGGDLVQRSGAEAAAER